MLMACGLLRGDDLDRETVKRTLEKVLDVWDFDTAWGWDFAVMAIISRDIERICRCICRGTARFYMHWQLWQRDAEKVEEIPDSRRSGTYRRKELRKFIEAADKRSFAQNEL